MRSNILKYFVIAALLINATTLIFFWLKRPAPKRIENIIIDELKMDNQQQAIYTMQHRAHHHLHDSLLQLIAAQRRILYAQKQSANDTILQKIGALQQEIELVTHKHFIDVRNICTPEQQIILDNLLEKTFQRLLQPKPPMQK
jgi:hypothetical protein